MSSRLNQVRLSSTKHWAGRRRGVRLSLDSPKQYLHRLDGREKQVAMNVPSGRSSAFIKCDAIR